MNAIAHATRRTEVDTRLRLRVERLQRLLDHADVYLETDGNFERARSVPRVCHPPDTAPPLQRRPLADGRDLRHVEAIRADKHKPLLPFVGYPNAAVAHTVNECVGLNLLGADRRIRDNVLREMQTKITQSGQLTYVCLINETDFSYYIQRGITFEYIGYLDRLKDPQWQRYFDLDIELIKAKYGIRQLVPAGDPRYAK